VGVLAVQVVLGPYLAADGGGALPQLRALGVRDHAQAHGALILVAVAVAGICLGDLIEDASEDPPVRIADLLSPAALDSASCLLDSGLETTAARGELHDPERPAGSPGLL
jgi:hypothetical protein